jgi:gag-polyprotein putative aspartyl protease
MNRHRTVFVGGAVALAFSLVSEAHAGITCDLTDTRGNVLQYSFARGWEGGTNELRVLRNNIVLSNGGPVWSRFFDRARNKLVLQQGNYSLAYEVRPDGLAPAGLFAGNNPVAMGTCHPDYSLDGPQPPVEVQAAPPVVNAPVIVQAPTPALDNSRLDDIERTLADLANRPAPAPAPSQAIIVAPAAPAAAPVIINNSPAAPPPAATAPAAAPAPAAVIYADPCQDPHYATSARCAAALAPAAQAAPAQATPAAPTPAVPPPKPSGDAVPLIPINNALYLHVAIDGHDELMQLDTGANISTIKESLADSLVAAGEAIDMGAGEYVMANGTKSTNRTVIVKRLQLGSHRKGDVTMAVVPNDGMQLLGLSVLNSIGTFSITNDQLVFQTTETAAALRSDLPTQGGLY